MSRGSDRAREILRDRGEEPLAWFTRLKFLAAFVLQQLPRSHLGPMAGVGSLPSVVARGQSFMA
eukprot:14967414-Alexandrium_andersonii.AAC.1